MKREKKEEKVSYGGEFVLNILKSYMEERVVCDKNATKEFELLSNVVALLFTLFLASQNTIA